MTEQTLIQGWGAPGFKQQFPQLDDARAARLDTLNKAIASLRMADLLTDAQVITLRQKKFPKLVKHYLAEVARQPQ